MPSTWFKIKNYISPVKTAIFAAAPIQKPTKGGDRVAGRLDKDIKNPFEDPVASEKGLRRVSSTGSIDSLESVVELELTSRPKKNVFDIVTKYAGSNWVFGVMLFFIGAWVVMGAVSGTTDSWQILLQNVSSIQVYVTDILLLRQQSNASQSLLTTLAEMQSRSQTCDRLLRQIPNFEWMETHKEPAKRIMSPNGKAIEDETEDSILLDMKMSRISYVWTRTCHVAAVGIGSLYAYIFYWIGIFAWIAIGPIFGFSNTWQLYVNTATAIVLTFASMFLQNVEQRQEDNLEKSLEYATKIDAEIEGRLREITGDRKPNPIFEIQPPKIDRLERSIDNFGNFMGSGIGVVFSLIATIIWISVGPMLGFDDNWVLIIGTFTGLIGFIDGFILRNLYQRGEASAEAEFRNLQNADNKLIDRLNLPHPVRAAEVQPTLAMRISGSISDFLGTKGVSAGSVGLVILLLVAASALLWSETGQLLCNTPTMIIEGFLLLVLIQAHNISSAARGREFSGILKRRVILNYAINNVEIVVAPEDTPTLSRFSILPGGFAALQSRFSSVPAEAGAGRRSMLPPRMSRMFGGNAI